MHALKLGDLFSKDGKGMEGWDEYEREVLEYADETSQAGREMGNASQFGKGGKLRDDIASK